jgi:hypothetical protein
MASLVSHVITRHQPSDLLGRRLASTNVMGKQYPAPTCGVLPSARDLTGGPRATQAPPSHGSTPPLLHSTLVVFLSPLIAHPVLTFRALAS